MKRKVTLVWNPLYKVYQGNDGLMYTRDEAVRALMEDRARLAPDPNRYLKAAAASFGDVRIGSHD
jgi:hypothetical protein